MTDTKTDDEVDGRGRLDRKAACTWAGPSSSSPSRS